jgi:hypothetical protein
MKIVGQNGYHSMFPLQEGHLVKWEFVMAWRDEESQTLRMRYSIRYAGILPKEFWYLLPNLERSGLESYLTIPPTITDRYNPSDTGESREGTPMTFIFVTFVAYALPLTFEASQDSALVARWSAWFLNEIKNNGGATLQVVGQEPPAPLWIDPEALARARLCFV